MNKLIMVVIDGLNDQVATMNLGFMQHLVETGIGRKSTISATLPTLSRPLYETILTGKTPIEHGIVNNDIVRKSQEVSLFHRVEAAGYKSAAVAYSWISELYMKTPFNPQKDCYQLEGRGPIHYGVYYYEDMHPDAHLFATAQYLLDKFNPEFIYIHPMNVDYQGHLHGGRSKQYSITVRMTDKIISDYIPHWLSLGYEVIVTADHGMGEDGAHSGIHDEERLVPFWYVSNKNDLEALQLPERQTDILEFVLRVMEI